MWVKQLGNAIVYWSGLASLYQLLTSRYVRILTYHHVGYEPGRLGLNRELYTSPRTFERQMRWLKYHCHPMSLKEVAQYLADRETVPAGAVVVTFDDGYADNYHYAWPILRRYEIPATIFLTTGYVGTERSFWWDELAAALEGSPVDGITLDFPDLYGNYELRTPSLRRSFFSVVCDAIKRTPPQRGSEILGRILAVLGSHSRTGRSVLTWDEVREMASVGMDFGSHTVDHVILTRVSAKEVYYQITASKAAIEAQIDRKVCSFSYPDGAFNDMVREMLPKVGYRISVTIRDGHPAKHGDDLFALSRIPVSEVGGWSVWRNRVAGIYAFATTARRSLYAQIRS